MPSFSTVGHAIPRVDGSLKVHGAAIFPSDRSAPGLLHCRPVLAPYPHARIDRVDTEEALALPGIVRILTARDLPGPNRYSYTFDRPIFCSEKTRYEGDIVALVVAESERGAETASRSIRIDYTPLPLLTDPAQALSTGAPRIHESGNILRELHLAYGDPTAALARPDLVTVSATYEPPAIDHAFLETESGFAEWDGEMLTVTTGGQSPFHYRSQIAQALSLPLEKVRVVAPYAGGSFGGKVDVNVQVLVGLAAYLTHRPCRLQWTRREHFLAGVKRHPGTLKLVTAATREGELVALDAHVLLDKGAYSIRGDVLLEVLVENLTGPYRIPNVRIDAWSVFTNNFVCGAWRGFGAGKACLAIESQVSRLARELGIDPVEFRKKNAVQQGERHGTGHRLLASIHIAQTLDAVAQHPVWRERQQLPRASGPVRRGTGMAISMKGYGLGTGGANDYGAATLTLLPDGRIRLAVGASDFGQASVTALVQIAAEALHCDLSALDISSADTQESIDFGPTNGSRVVYAVGRAELEAADKLLSQLCQVAAEWFQIAPAAVEIRKGAAHDPATGRSLTFAEIAQRAEEPLHASARVLLPFAKEPSETPLPHPHVLYSGLAQVAQVAVDVETGQVKIERLVAFPDVGQVINPQGVEGQCEGGMIQGLGYTSMERLLVREGRIQNPDLATYPIPTAMDIPDMEVVPIEIPEPTGPFGAKGLAESTPLATAPAILDAIEDAIGIRFTRLPVTPELVFEALEARAVAGSRMGASSTSD